MKKKVQRNPFTKPIHCSHYLNICYAPYNAFYDCYFCEKCDLWLEGKCGGSGYPDCSYHCAERPEKPSLVGKNA